MFYFVKQSHRAPAVTAPVPVKHVGQSACVIGAGSSGLTAAKSLYLAGIDFDCFEKGDTIGGNWVYDNPNGQSACYETLEINTSCPRMAFSDFPMPKHYPHYARHDQIAAYFEDYAKHFGFRDKITFNTTVTKVEPDPNAGWLVSTSGPQGDNTQHYDYVLVANGHHWDPHWPNPAYPGSFNGEQIHAHSYRSAEQLAGRKVVVVGAGNSAMDIAVEASKHAATTHWSVRRAQWVFRKLLFGQALDQAALPGWLPWWATAARLRFGALVSGDMTKYGLPKPPHTPGQSHPVQSEQIRNQLEAGAIAVQPGIERLDGNQVVVTDGASVEADLIVWATGYNVRFPFFDEDYLSAPDNSLPLWKRTLHPDHPGLFFIGLLQPVGAVMPLAQAQAEWVAEIISGDYKLPAPQYIRKRMGYEHERNLKQFYDSPRHTMEVDFDAFLWDLGRERKAGRERVQASL